MTPTDHMAARINAYVDGTATPAERAEFERLLATNADVRAEYELHQRIESRLKTLMQVPPAPVLPMNARQATAPAGPLPAPRQMLSAGWMRIAAGILLASAVGLLVISKPWNMLSSKPESSISAQVVLDRLVSDGFVPVTVCDTEAKFAQYTKDKLGTAFLVRASPDVELVGWTYASGLLGDEAPILMARHAGKPVMVVMNAASMDHTMRPSTAPGMHLHRLAFENLVFYEYSSSPEPVVISHLTLP